MTRRIKYGVWVISGLATLGILGYAIFISNFSLFGGLKEEVIIQACDHDGLRRAKLYKLSGNATVNPSVHISIGRCGDNNNLSAVRKIFTAERSNIKDREVTIKWISFDTLLVEYPEGLEIFSREDEVNYPDATLDLHIIYAKIRPTHDKIN